MLSLLLAAVAAVTTPTGTVTGCSSVAANKVATSADRTKLGRDIECAKAAAVKITAPREARLAKLGPVVAPIPTPLPTPTPVPINPVEPPQPGPVPIPPPLPVEPAVPTPPTTAPTLAGLPVVDSGIGDVSKYLQPAWGTGGIPGKDLFEGAFRFLCAPAFNAYNDPVVFPGQPGKSHLHTFFGNTKADAYSTYESLRKTGESTCNNLLNRSAYWIPALMNGHGKVVMPDYVSIYYKGHPAGDKACAIAAKFCVGLPRGLRYVFGYNMQNPAANRNPGYWNCDGPGATSGHFPNIAQAAKGCPVGSRLGAVISAPNCWNGTQLDSPDHRSHMAFPTNDIGEGIFRCPATHPYLIPQFTLGAWYMTDATLDRSGNESPDAETWFLSSDRMAGMVAAVPGTTLHGDWFGAWEDGILARWEAACISQLLSCSGGDLGDGWQLKTTEGYNWMNLPGTKLVDPPAAPAGSTSAVSKEAMTHSM